MNTCDCVQCFSPDTRRGAETIRRRGECTDRVIIILLHEYTQVGHFKSYSRKCFVIIKLHFLVKSTTHTSLSEHCWEHRRSKLQPIDFLSFLFCILLSKSKEKVRTPKQIMPAPCCADEPATITSWSSQSNATHVSSEHMHQHRHTGVSRTSALCQSPMSFPPVAQGRPAMPRPSPTLRRNANTQ